MGRPYDIEVVGGPWDGEKLPSWNETPGDMEPPERILIGQCSGRDPWGCTGSRQQCWTLGGGREHSCWWAPDEMGIPFDAVAYRRAGVEEPEGPQGRGRVSYVYGRIKTPESITTSEELVAHV
jgi:hypothetical protein